MAGSSYIHGCRTVRIDIRKKFIRKTDLVLLGLFRGLLDGLFGSFLLLAVFLILGRVLCDNTSCHALSGEDDRVYSYVGIRIVVNEVVLRGDELEEGLEDFVVFFKRLLEYRC